MSATSSEISVRSELPLGYDVGETHGDTPVFSCPEHGCDGMTFYTVQECKVHQNDWHEGPYLCTCDEKFAARPALKRHIRLCLHQEVEPEIFACDAICCPKFEEPIKDSSSLSSHNRSATHQAAVERNKYFDNIREAVEKSIQDRILAFRGLICDVPNCPEFDRQWSSPFCFLKHVGSEEHARYNAAFEKAMTSGSARLANQEKRSWIFQCHRERCDEFRQRFRTNLDYREHCATDSHIQASKVVRSRLQTPDPSTQVDDLQDTGLLSPPLTEPTDTPRKPTRVLIDLTGSPNW